ncbi:MAG: Metallo-beta-lactamase superfamily protein [Methanosaeta sp. PtaU1.Bin112]|nr:MAG: Metallo-beta-lactamase superfamily protein [Methanosaeta sp. PtaU1.Bin112]
MAWRPIWKRSIYAWECNLCESRFFPLSGIYPQYSNIISRYIYLVLRSVELRKDEYDGLIVIDPGESINAAQTVKNAFNEHLDDVLAKKTVKAIIYTHHHDCHIHGASVFAGNDSPEIIAHENLNATLFYDWYSQLYPGRVEGGAKMSGALFANDSGWYAGGGLFAVQIPGPSGLLPPTRTVSDSLDTTIAGVNITLLSAPGETRDVLTIWLKDKKILVQIANLYQSMPAETTLRGACFRNPLDYVSSIDLYRSLDPECMVLIHGPNPVVAGKENVSALLTNYRDAIQFIHDQTVQYMNKGLSPGEIAEILKLPPHLAKDPYLQEFYAQVDRNIYETFWWYRESFTGKCRDLFLQSPKEQALMAAELAGGVDGLAAKAAKAIDNGSLEWALILADDALILDPENSQARKTKDSAMISLAEGTINAQTRNYLLSEYLLETGQAKIPILGKPRLVFAGMNDNIVPLMPMDDLFRIMAVSLNATKSLDSDLVIALKLTGKNGTTEASDYSLHVRHGVFEAMPQTAENAKFTIETEPLVWKNLCLGKLNPQEAVLKGDVKILGADPKAFY